MITRRILVIEDDPDTALLLRSHLLEIGYPPANVVTAGSLADSQQWQGDHIDVVITTLELPDSSAAETFQRVKAFFPEQPVIVVSGHDENGFGTQLLEQGADDYLVKGAIDRHQLERSLRYARARKKAVLDYRRMFEECPIPMYVFDAETLRFLEVNEAAMRQYGYSKAEMLKMTADEIRPPETRDKFRQAQSGIVAEFHNYGRWLHQHRDGHRFWVNVHAHAMEFEGRVARMVLAINVDEQVRTEMMLQEKAKEKEQILESITDGFMTIDKQHRVTYVNKTFEKVIQRSAADVIGRDIWTEVFPESVSLKFHSEYQKAITEQISVHFEEFYPPLQIWLSVNAYPSEQGLTVFFMDITREKTMQEAIALNEQNLRAIISNTDDMIWSVDRNYRFITANPKFEKMVRMGHGNTMDALRREELGEELYKQWKQLYDRAFKGESFKVIQRYEFDGKENFQEVSFNPIRNDAGDVIGISCFSKDITQQQQHLRMIEEQNKKLRQITWMQCHEMRRPVANILGLIALMNTNEIPPGENLEIISHLATSAKQLDDMIRQVTKQTQELTGEG